MHWYWFGRMTHSIWYWYMYICTHSLWDSECATVLRNGSRCITSIAHDGHVLVMKIPRVDSLRVIGAQKFILLAWETAVSHASLAIRAYSAVHKSLLCEQPKLTFAILFFLG